MFSHIKKRDGRIVKFDSSKIKSAIARAGKATGEFGDQEAKNITHGVLDYIHKSLHDSILDVEEIQDIVEQVLFDSSYFRTTKAYILYREQHAQIRAITTRANVDLVETYLNRSDWKNKENSNMTFSVQGLNHRISASVNTEYWLNRIYPPEIQHAHKNGDLHIHDLSILAPYCVGWDLRDLLLEGFRGVEGKVESSPARHFRTALGQIVNFFYTLQGEAAGAQALSSFDTFLAPFVRRDGLNYGEVKQAIQEFLFNINIPTRVGFQTPFTNITLDLFPSPVLKDHPVVIGGKTRNETYGDFQHEMNMINRAFAEVMMEGDAKGRVFTFPIPTYNLTKEFDWDNPELEMVWRMTGKYGIPYFANFINSDMSPADALAMCCRLWVDKRELIRRGGGLFGSYPLTGSIGVVTINLPRIGFLAENEKDFFERLKKMIILAKESLSIKRKVLENLIGWGLYPYSKFYLRNVKQKTGSYWKLHFSTIGVIGMNEACLNFLGQDIGTGSGRSFSLRVLEFIRNMIADMQKQTGDVFNLEATPAEGTSYRLSLLDKKVLPDIICANQSDYLQGAEPFYTNSTQLPVNYTDDIFETLMLQDELQSRYTGGTVLHIYLGERIEEIETIKTLIKKIATGYSLPYFTLTPTFSVCPSHGYLNGQQEKCPYCQKETEVYSRVVGYFRPVKQWNKGKQAEFSLRKSFKIV